MRLWVWFGAVVMLAACGGDDPPAPRTCRAQEWNCGVDDLGTACGRCPVDFTCTSNRCIFRTECLCTGRACGMDPCGAVSCGTCASGTTCVGGLCR